MKLRTGIVLWCVLAFLAALIWEVAGAQPEIARKPRQTAESWQTLTLPAGLQQLSGHTVVWTGQKALIWGGRLGGWNSRWATNRGWIFDPADNSMTEMSTAGAPSPRYYHTAVWTGSKMIVWGGMDHLYQTYGNGAIYDPATNTWSAMGGTPPGGRCKHTAIWTGSKMIVWGGNPIDGVPYSDGKSYDPADNTWTPIAASPLAARSQHTAVWTGSKMIVWGGVRSSANYYADGAIYDPVANQWTMLPDSPLAARDNHFAAWTGSAMAVVGGSNYTTVFIDGALYDSALNSWRSLDLSGHSGRTLASGDFDGSRVLLWGGVRSGTILNDGLNIDPGPGTWQPMTNVGAPGPRFEHQAVWAGVDRGLLIVGGVETDYNRPCSVAIFRPATAPNGSLEVFITPEKAVTDDVKWRRVGTPTWRVSGERETGIPVGTYDIEFQKPANWTGPDQLSVTINDGQVTRVDQEFTEIINAAKDWMHFR